MRTSRNIMMPTTLWIYLFACQCSDGRDVVVALRCVALRCVDLNNGQSVPSCHKITKYLLLIQMCTI